MAKIPELPAQHCGKSRAELETELTARQDEFDRISIIARLKGGNTRSPEIDALGKEILSLHEALKWHDGNDMIAGLGDVYGGPN